MTTGTPFRKALLAAALWAGLCLGSTAAAQVQDYIRVDLPLANSGLLGIEFNKAWGKPTFETTNGITTMTFGPHGPKKKPTFLTQIAGLTANTVISDEALMQFTQKELTEVRALAAETNISITDVKGENVSGHFFSITDRESKFGEYDYLTVAVLGSGHMLVKCYFFSNDGALDFGEDAIRLMESIEYTPPLPATAPAAE